MDKEKLKIKYFKTKQELDDIRNDETLRKWKVLSEAYKLGKKIWGHRFSRQRLAFDMELPMTTVYRCLALDRANINSIKKMDEGKISAFKLAMICQLKSITFQDEIVNLVIEKNLSTYQIKDLKINEIEDVNKERHRIAVQKGYSRKSTAIREFKNWIDRGRVFLSLKKDDLPKTKYKSLKEHLEELKKEIEDYIDGD